MDTREHTLIPGCEIAGLASDSRKVRPGYLFAAFPGWQQDGRAFIDDAIARGATAILAGTGVSLDNAHAGVSLLSDDNPRLRFAKMAAGYFGAQPDTVAAVTGTNGKTSVCWFARQIWERAGCKAASLGTLGLVTQGKQTSGSLTTPDPAALHEMLAGLKRDGVNCLAMEASSHGLDQYRLDGVRAGIGAFTNFSRDHLDYHVNMESYLAAKVRLFTEVMAPGGVVVLNADCPEAGIVEGAARGRGHRILTFGRKGSDIRLLDIKADATGQAIRIVVMDTPHDIHLPLAGGFQVMNALCALGIVMASERIEAEKLVAHLEALVPVPGRMERIGETAAGGHVYVDYAHTPDALRTVLAALRGHAEGRLHVVFGCGGDRDPGKRAEMGAVAAGLADGVIVTDDNPRNEDPTAIRAAIVEACKGADEIGDRKTAIGTALENLGAGDVLLVAGKGHETGQIIGEQVLPFDDGAVIRGFLEGGGA